MGGAVSYAVISYKRPRGTGKKAKRISIKKKNKKIIKRERQKEKKEKERYHRRRV